VTQAGTAPTVAELLLGATDRLRVSGSESARLDAELLLAYALGVERTTVLAHPEARPGSGQAQSFAAAVERRAAGEPVAYIRGFKEFYGLAFSIDSRALIPRPETERLVELAEARVRTVLTGSPRPEDAPPYRVWDVGTGSGAICVALAVVLRRHGYGDAVELFASDRSERVLGIAVENAVGHGVADRLTFAAGDMFDVSGAPSTVDLVVSNPPYVPSDAIPGLPIAASFEPRDALDGGPDGLDVVRRLLAGVPEVLGPEGAALIEIGADQADAVLDLAAGALAGWTARIHEDLAGRPRVLEVDRGDEGPLS